MKKQTEGSLLSKSDNQERVSRRKLIATMGITGAAVLSSNIIPGLITTATAANDKEKGPITDDAERISYTYEKGLKQSTVAKKLREMVSVKDFGAIGDGKTDDTAAIQQAIKSVIEQNKRELFFPSGTYKENSTSKDAEKITFVGDGVTFTSGNFTVVSLADHHDQIKSLNRQLASQKDVRLSDATESYLFDLDLKEVTVNQALIADEVDNHLYATQVKKVDGDEVESFVISRLALGGMRLDSMLVRHGGHGTSIGLERDGNKIYIWTNMIQVNSSGGIATQYLCRLPYVPNEEIGIGDGRVKKYIQFPDTRRYMTPFSDVKNNLLAIRHTDTRSGRITRIDVHNIEDIKKGSNKVIYSYNFTKLMNESVLQGLTIDSNILYVTFGQGAEDFHLFKINMETDEIIEEIKRPVGHNEFGRYNFDFGEPEGMFLYTDPETGYKTLLTVLVMDAAGRRRQKLFAFSSNIGIQKFQGFAHEKSQNIKLTRDDGKGIRLKDVTSIASIRKPGFYYMTTVEGDAMDDHPLKGVAGWWLNVTPSDASGQAVHQELIRNSSVTPQRYTRVVPSDKPATPWRIVVEQVPVEKQTISFENGWTNHEKDKNMLNYYKNAMNELVLSGIVSNKSGKVEVKSTVFTLPEEYRPATRHAVLARTSNGIAELVIHENGEIYIGEYIVGKEAEFIYMNAIVSIE